MSWIKVLFLLLFLCVAVNGNVEQNSYKKTIPTGVIDAFNNEVFVLFTNPPAYNKFIPPQENRPIRVNIGILLLGYGTIYDAKTEFSLNLLLRISWFDERLRPWNATVANGKNVTILEGGSWHLERLWTPSLHVPNSKEPNILQDRTHNPILTRIQSDGQILVSKRIILNGVSQMDFRLYPLDVQAIDFKIESNELSYNNLQLDWNAINAMDTHENFDWNGFEMHHFELQKSYANYTHTGAFSKVTATFYLSRIFGQFILDIYVPIYLYVIISWGSFWIEITAAPARITLGVTVLLTMVTASRNAREKLPPVSYIHALDIWITVCIFFVFGVLVEYTAVNYIYFKEKRSQAKKNKRKKSMLKRQDYERTLMRHDSSNNVNNNNSALEHHLRTLAEINDKWATRSSITIAAADIDHNTNNNNNNYQHQNKKPSVDVDNLSIASSSETIEPVSEYAIWTSKPVNDCAQQQPQPPSPCRRSKRLIGRRVLHSICGLAFLCKRYRKPAYRRKRIEGCEEVAYEIDRLSRIVFPSAFLLFNVIYWLVIVVASRW